MPRTLTAPAHLPIVDDAPMRLHEAIDHFLTERQGTGHITSANTLKSYRYTLELHAKDVGNRDPSKIGKTDIQHTLSRWTNPNTRRQRHACLTAFYDWCCYADLARANPARLVEAPKARKPNVRRITKDEAIMVLEAAERDRRDRWAINLLIFTGARRDELCGLRRSDLMRPGLVRLYGKGGKERWMPVSLELQPIVDEILTLTANPDDYVIPSRRSLDPPFNTAMLDQADQRMTGAAMYMLVKRVGERAGLPIVLTPHVLRRFFAESVMAFAGQLATQTAMGHEKPETTQDYANGMSLDALIASMNGWSIGYRELPAENAIERPGEQSNVR
jgi:integrase